MTTTNTHWENELISLAVVAENIYNFDDFSTIQDEVVLQEAYQNCDELTKNHSKTFFMASSLLPPDKRRGARALYAFCRVSDDLVDRPRENSLQLLFEWRKNTINAQPMLGDHIAIAWDHTSRLFCIPWLYAEQLIDGVAMDLKKNRYQTIQELTA